MVLTVYVDSTYIPLLLSKNEGKAEVADVPTPSFIPPALGRRVNPASSLINTFMIIN